jgi:uncharacterized protein YycO
MPAEPSNVLRVALFSGGDPIAWVVRWQSRAKYSHAAFLLPCGQRVIESYPGAGVRIRHLSRKDWANIDLFEVEGLTLDLSRQVLAFCERERGKPYDWRSVLRFVSRTPARENGKWFCSELVFAALGHVGLDLLARIEAHNVSPGMLGLSHALKPLTPVS